MISPGHLIGHRDWAPGRKTDPGLHLVDTIRDWAPTSGGDEMPEAKDVWGVTLRNGRAKAPMTAADRLIDIEVDVDELRSQARSDQAILVGKLDRTGERLADVQDAVVEQGQVLQAILARLGPPAAGPMGETPPASDAP